MMQQPQSPNALTSAGGDGLADVLERVLDKGLVIAGDIQIGLLDIEVLTLKVRLLIASVDTAQQMGIDWWTRDPFLSTSADREAEVADGQHRELADVEERLRRIEELLSTDERAGQRTVPDGDGELGADDAAVEGGEQS